MAASTVTAASLGRGPQHFPASADLLEIREALDRDGLVVLRDVIDSSLVARINAELDPLLTETPLGCEHADEEMGEFLGPQTKRLNETLTRSPTITQHLVAHPRVIEVAESVLKEHCTSILVHQSQVFEQYPGETAQPFHRDDGLWPVEGARFPMSMTAFFALGEYTADVGATRALLGSHRWPEALHYEPKREGGWGRYNRPPREPAPEEIAVVEMPPGSAAIWVGPLLHAGGANITADRVRRGFIMAYSLGWLRGELNQQLMWPPEVARHFPREVQRLIGYAVEAPLIGCLEMGAGSDRPARRRVAKSDMKLGWSRPSCRTLRCSRKPGHSPPRLRRIRRSRCGGASAPYNWLEPASVESWRNTSGQPWAS